MSTETSSKPQRSVERHESGYATINGDVVGPRMVSTVRLVESRGPYRSMNALAICVGPNGSQRYGYQIVNRCIRKGLIELDDDHPCKTPQATGAVVLTQKGESLTAGLSKREKQ